MARIEATGLDKRYGTRHAVRDVSFTVEPGRITGLLGPNGSGKTTTLRLMVGLARGGGVTRFDGVPYAELDRPAERVGVLLDARAVHPGRRVRDHLRMVAAGSGIPPERVEQVLHRVGLASEATAVPKGFSLGMQQRLALATALLGDPEVLILDEPANGLDPQGMRWLRAFLRDLATDGRSVLVSSHVLAEMQLLADDVVVLARGELVAHAPIDEFIASASLSAVHVRADDAERLAAAIRRTGAFCEGPDDDDRLVVRGLEMRAIAGLAMTEGCLVTELFTATGSLEDAYLEASQGATDFDATLVHPEGGR